MSVFLRAAGLHVRCMLRVCATLCPHWTESVQCVDLVLRAGELGWGELVLLAGSEVLVYTLLPGTVRGLFTAASTGLGLG